MPPVPRVEKQPTFNGFDTLFLERSNELLARRLEQMSDELESLEKTVDTLSDNVEQLYKSVDALTKQLEKLPEQLAPDKE